MDDEVVVAVEELLLCLALLLKRGRLCERCLSLKLGLLTKLTSVLLSSKAVVKEVEADAAAVGCWQSTWLMEVADFSRGLP